MLPADGAVADLVSHGITCWGSKSKGRGYWRAERHALVETIKGFSSGGIQRGRVTMVDNVVAPRQHCKTRDKCLAS